MQCIYSHDKYIYHILSINMISLWSKRPHLKKSFRNAFTGNVAIDIYGVEMLLLENSVLKMYVKLPLRH